MQAVSPGGAVSTLSAQSCPGSQCGALGSRASCHSTDEETEAPRTRDEVTELAVGKTGPSTSASRLLMPVVICLGTPAHLSLGVMSERAYNQFRLAFRWRSPERAEVMKIPYLLTAFTVYEIMS